MQVFVISGELEKQSQYLASFKKEKNIAPYLIFEYDDFKIAEARSLQKILSSKLHDDERRLILIKNPTLDSQNALLKTLEELEDNTFVFFVSQNREELLSTILSRALYIDLGDTTQKTDDGLVSVFRKEYKEADILTAFDKLGPITQESFEVLILSLRDALLQSLDDVPQATTLSQTLKKLTLYYAFSKSNNINKQMILDMSILKN